MNNVADIIPIAGLIFCIPMAVFEAIMVKKYLGLGWESMAKFRTGLLGIHIGAGALFLNVVIGG